jgi:phosphoribosylaminoimidazole carboxylase (NCAIR synthetase)
MPAEIVTSRAVKLKAETNLRQMQMADQREITRVALDRQIVSLEMLKVIRHAATHKTTTQKICQKRRAIKPCHNRLYSHQKVLMAISIEAAQIMVVQDAPILVQAANIAVVAEAAKTMIEMNRKID